MTRDQAASPVVGTVLLLAFTLAAAATVMGWNPFPTLEPPAGDVALHGVDTTDEHTTDHLGLTLTKSRTGTLDADDYTLYVSTEHATHTAHGPAWTVGDQLLVPCTLDGPHVITVSARGNVLAQLTGACDAPPTLGDDPDDPRDDEDEDREEDNREEAGTLPCENADLNQDGVVFDVCL